MLLIASVCLSVCLSARSVCCLIRTFHGFCLHNKGELIAIYIDAFFFKNPLHVLNNSSSFRGSNSLIKDVKYHYRSGWVGGVQCLHGTVELQN